jgi:hypothetical protein
MMSFLFLANIGRRDFGRVSLGECSSEDVTFGGVLLCWWHLIWWAGLGIRLSFGGFVAAMVFPTASLSLSPCLSFPAGSDRVPLWKRGGDWKRLDQILLWFLFCRRRCGVFKPFFDRWQTRRKRLQNKYHNKTVSITPPFLLG